MKPFSFRILCLSLSLLMLTACGTSAPVEPPVTAPSPTVSVVPTPAPFALGYYPDQHMHPTLGTSHANLSLSPLIYEGLFALDASFSPVPVLCESWKSSEDNLVWNFTLRTGVVFSDGTPLTAELVADALTLAASDKSHYAQRLGDVSAIHATEGIVTITLSKASSALPALLDIPIALGNEEHPLGTGQYYLSEVDGDDVLLVHENWWRDLPAPIDEILLQPIRQSDDLIVAFDAGRISLIDTDIMGTNTLGYSGEYETWDYPTTGMLFLGANTAEGPCASAQLRRIMTSCIDRESIAQVDYARHALPATLPAHPSAAIYDTILAATVPYDPAFVSDMVRELPALDAPLRLLVNSENAAKLAAATRISADLNSAGIATELVALPFNEFTTALETGAFDLYLGEVVLTGDFDISPLIGTGGSLNFGNWSDADTDSMLALLGAAPQQGYAPSATNLYWHLLEQSPIIPICFKNGSVLTQWGRISGITATQNNIFWGLENWTVS